MSESRYFCHTCNKEFLVTHGEIADPYAVHRCANGEPQTGVLVNARSYVSRETIAPCIHKDQWRPKQRTCLRCHAKYQKNGRRKVREEREVSHDLLEQCRNLICEKVCLPSQHHDLCRMVSVFLRVYAPIARPLKQKPAVVDGMRKLHIWYQKEANNE